MVADVLLEHHLPMIRAGRARTLLAWISTLSDEAIIARPALAAAGATAAISSGDATVVRQRLLALADRGIEASDDDESYARAVSAMVRAAAIDGSIGEAIAAGRLSVELATTDPAAEGVLVSAYGALARALYFAGDDDGAWTAALAAIIHPDAERRAPGHALARSTLAIIAVVAGPAGAARVHAETARSILGGVGMIRTWLGGNASVALGSVLLAEGHLPAAERELAHAEHVFRDEVATVHSAWVLVLLARVPCRRGRLDEAAAAVRGRPGGDREYGDMGVRRHRSPTRSGARSRTCAGAPATARCWCSRARPSWRCSGCSPPTASMREIGAELFISSNTVRSHTRALYRKLGVGQRADAVARGQALGLLGRSQSPR